MYVTWTQVKILHKQQTSYVRVYKATLKPIWTYGIQLWVTASISNIEILERWWTHFGSCRIRLSEGISKHQHLKEKSAAKALNTVFASVNTQMA
jgi:hypothetical protein